MNTVTLWRPVGQAELDLITKASFGGFPSRLFHQPIFYPVTNREYAEQIACDWNTTDPASGYVGYVTEFDVDATFLAKYPVQKVGGALHTEYWIPAEELEDFNAHIVGAIRVVAEFRGKK